MKRVLVLFLILVCTTNLFALDDRVLVLPPSYNEVDSNTGVWQEIISLYQTSVLGKTPIPISEIALKWSGEIRVTDYQNPGDGFTFGQEFDADYVLMTQLHMDQDYLEMQLLNPWEGTVLKVVSGNSTVEALFKLEKEDWIFGVVLNSEIPQYEEPVIAGGDITISLYIEQNNTYPPDARIELKEAQLDIEVTVSREGVPVKVKILSNSLPEYDFEKVVEQALWAVKYNPAKTIEGAVNALLKKRLTVYPEP